MKHDYKKFIKFVAIILILIGVYCIGYGIGHNNLNLEKGYKVKITDIDKGKPKDVDFSYFWEAWNIVKTKFFDKKLNYQKMVYGAIDGMLQALGDPYTTYMNPDEAKIFNEDMNGSFGGIGVELTVKEGILVVISPLDDSPAQKAGMRPRDVILKIDGVDVSKYTYSEAINKIRGEKGTNINLTVLHYDDKKTEDITVTRDVIKNDSVKWEIKNDDIMYVRIAQFGDDTFDLLNKVADEVQSKNVSKMIVDVRDDPGGYLAKAIDVSSLFLPEGSVVVQEEDRNGDKEQMKTTRLPRFKDIKLAVLINEGSASASEIFAGAMQDHKKGTIIGVKSFGKGSVQTLEKLGDNSQVKMTIAKWLTPEGRAIDKEGIKPDIEVTMTKEDIENKNDLQLQRAIEEINK